MPTKVSVCLKVIKVSMKKKIVCGLIAVACVPTPGAYHL